MSLGDPARLAVGTFTVLPVRPPAVVDAVVAGRAMSAAPLVGLALGAIGSLVVVVGRDTWTSGAGDGVAAALAIAVLALATRGLHLDGLADTADGLGSRHSRLDAVAVMRQPDLGPFGVATLTLVLVLQVVAVASGPWWALLIAVPVGRLAVTAACSRGVPAATTDGLGAAVAGTVHPGVALAWTAVALLAAVVADGGRGALAVVVGLALAALLLLRCIRRVGGVTGDVLGAVCEVATTGVLLVLAAR